MDSPDYELPFDYDFWGPPIPVYPPNPIGAMFHHDGSQYYVFSKDSTLHSDGRYERWYQCMNLDTKDEVRITVSGYSPNHVADVVRATMRGVVQQGVGRSIDVLRLIGARTLGKLIADSMPTLWRGEVGHLLYDDDPWCKQYREVLELALADRPVDLVPPTDYRLLTCEELGIKDAPIGEHASTVPMKVAAYGRFWNYSFENSFNQVHLQVHK